MSLPRVHIIGLGGTIAMAGSGALGVVPTLTPVNMIAAGSVTGLLHILCPQIVLAWRIVSSC